jgi:hypothetical protein
LRTRRCRRRTSRRQTTFLIQNLFSNNNGFFQQRVFTIFSSQTENKPGHLEFRLVRDGQSTSSAGLFIDAFTYSAFY